MLCQMHQTEMEWVESSPGRKTLCCKQCRANEYSTPKQRANLVPLVKFSDTFHRELPIERVKAWRDR